MTEVADAQAMILTNMPTFEAVRLPLEGCTGRVLAEAALAERDQPPFDRVTMDGIAIAYDDLNTLGRSFECIGTQAAGAAAMRLTKPGQCLEVMTGAMRPAGADTIVPVERLSSEGSRRTIHNDASVAPGQFIHARGSDGKQGQQLLAAGLRLTAPEIAVLASAGYATVAVAAQARVAVASTGDELVGLEEAIEPHQIRSTNDLAIAASLERASVAQVTRTRLGDDEKQLLESIDRLHADHDVLILSGGVSMGQFDFVPAVLERLGAQLVFHKIQQKPGRPMWFGLSRDGKPIFALPGNPVSTLVCATRYILPAMKQACGLNPEANEIAALTEDVAAPVHLTYFIPVKISWSDSGQALAAPRPTNTSGDFISLAGTDGVLELPKGREVHPAGTAGRVWRW